MRKIATCCPHCTNKSNYLFNTKDLNYKITKNIFSYRRCQKCGLIFLSNIPKDLGAYYQEDYYQIPSVEQLAIYASKIQYQVDMVSKFVSKGKLLEIGSAFGVFAYQAKKSGFDVDSIEMSERCCNYLVNTVGVKAFQSDKPQDIIHSLGRYDVVVFWHNIEHLIEPWRVLESVAEKIVPGGIMLIATPNPDSISFKLLGSSWPHVDAPRHISLIPEPLLTKFLETFGFRPVMKTTNDKGGRSWNRFSWQRLLMNYHHSKIVQNIGYAVGWLISIPMAILENTDFNGSAYTVIYQKSNNLRKVRV